MKVLVDGDILVYRAGFAADKTLYEVYLGEMPEGKPALETTTYRDVQNFVKGIEGQPHCVVRSAAQGGIEAALGGAKDMIGTILDKSGADEMQIYLSGKKNFREDLATFAKYKGNRDKQRRPLFYQEIKDYLCNVWGAVYSDGCEADDAMGLAQEKDTMIVSIDKDLLQIPGRHFNWVRDEMTTVSIDEGIHLFYKQILTGDRTDNIVGIPGVGDKTAEKLLAKCPQDRWDTMIVEEYRKGFTKKPLEGCKATKYGLTYNHHATGKECFKTYAEYAREVAQLVWIQRKGGEECPFHPTQ